MENKQNENSMQKEMEYVLKFLEREWERTGETKEVQVIGLREISLVNFEIERKIKENKEQLSLDISFRNSLKLTRENYVLLRLARKIKAEKDKADQDNQRWFYVGLDVEEYELYMKITEDEETGGNKDGGEV
ncbi:hypothetical protein [Eubacterium ventriosum]|jgi:hypothetical protein|uniref:Uncharacterized protein n=1 Tax=Eubacterium ventriosum TaxID=39496 RepID=A0A415LH94_9FIRM|nr:hypothetical protein [Eubacterium ventriosum]RHL47902.1 hypothetical protein DW018_00250 [Eubacterium ventriosum]